ncbi:MAG TPA: hypothetical protein DDW85_02430 [Porphyromonadaceae bacterium]|nr:hypothetical protein [Porphyromonadaceae bacterium]
MNKKIIIPSEGVNEIPDGYRPLITNDGKFIAIVPRDMKESDIAWILNYEKELQPNYWEQRRYELAKAAMVELMKYDYYKNDGSDGTYPATGLLSNNHAICHLAVNYADTMIEVLKKRKGE